MGSDTLISLLLNAIRDDWVDLLNLVGKGAVSQFTFHEIYELWKSISRGKVNYVRFPEDPFIARVSKSTSGLVSQIEVNNLLDIFL